MLIAYLVIKTTVGIMKLLCKSYALNRRAVCTICSEYTNIVYFQYFADRKQGFRRRHAVSFFPGAYRRI